MNCFPALPNFFLPVLYKLGYLFLTSELVLNSESYFANVLHVLICMMGGKKLI